MQIDPKYRYIAFVVTAFFRPFIALLPPENFYSQPALIGAELVQPKVQVQPKTLEVQRAHPEKVQDFSCPDLSDLGCNEDDAKMLEYCISQGKNQTDSIFQVFGCKKGGNAKYKRYCEAYQRIKEYLNRPKNTKPATIEEMAYSFFLADNEA